MDDLKDQLSLATEDKRRLEAENGEVTSALARAEAKVIAFKKAQEEVQRSKETLAAQVGGEAYVFLTVVEKVGTVLTGIKVYFFNVYPVVADLGCFLFAGTIKSPP